MVKTYAYGFPRIGKNREYKKAIEKFWKKNSEQGELISKLWDIESDMEKTYSPQSEDILDLVFRDFFPEKRINKRGLRKDWDFLDLAKKGL